MPAVVAVTFQNGRPLFDQSCYYAPADEDFVLMITNTIFALDDKTPARLTLLISDSDNPAVTPVPARPGFWEGIPSRAVFVAPDVVAPDTARVTVPALSAGIYLLQVMYGVREDATLIVR
jgi:hypothetical protein